MITVVASSTRVFRVAFTDEDGTAIIPVTVHWSLMDSDGTIINGRENVLAAPADSTMDIVLSGADLAWTGDSRRILRIMATYVSDLSDDDLPMVHDERFDIARPAGG